MTIEDVQSRLIESSTKTYTARSERAAMRCALGDASSFCDSYAKQIAEEHRGRKGKGATTKRGRELETIVRHCGDLIWSMREKIKVDG